MGSILWKHTNVYFSEKMKGFVLSRLRLVLGVLCKFAKLAVSASNGELSVVRETVTDNPADAESMREQDRSQQGAPCGSPRLVTSR